MTEDRAALAPAACHLSQFSLWAMFINWSLNSTLNLADAKSSPQSLQTSNEWTKIALTYRQVQLISCRRLGF
jgi:hypothetical protein